MNKLIRLGAIALALSSSWALAGQDSVNVPVKASIADKCKLSISSQMNFGVLDVTKTTDATKDVVLTYGCTRGTLATLKVGGSIGPKITPTLTSTTTTDTIGYEVSWTDPGTYTGKGLSPANVDTLTLSGTIPNLNYVDKAPASYSDSIAITMDY